MSTPDDVSFFTIGDQWFNDRKLKGLKTLKSIYRSELRFVGLIVHYVGSIARFGRFIADQQKFRTCSLHECVV